MFRCASSAASYARWALATSAWNPVSAGAAPAATGARGLIAGSSGAAEELRQAAFQCLLHHDPVLIRDDDALELRNPPALRLQIERLDVEQRLLDRDH